ncbi:MAG: hypothetical protein JNJ91_13055 [Flavobacteriales bacterium]|nr:hypothetical protein [Flavobacteriales bacterium]
MKRTLSVTMSRVIVMAGLFCGWSTLRTTAQVILTFTATSDDVHIPLDSVHVINLTQGGDTVLYAPDTALVLDFSTGLGNDLFAGRGLSVHPPFPNPFDGSTRFQVDSDEPGQLVLSGYDLTGRVVASMQRQVNKGQHAFSFQGGRQGVLLLVAEMNGKRSVQRMVALATDKTTSSSLTYHGETWVDSNGSPKDLWPFSWAAGDSLVFVGYVISSIGLDSLVSGSIPVTSASVMFPFVQAILDDPLSSDENDLWESLPDTVLQLQDIILPSGISAYDFLLQYDPDWLSDPPYDLAQPNEVRSLTDVSGLPANVQKEMLLSRMLDTGRHLVTDALHVYPAGTGPNEPAQPNGLAYGFGSKVYRQRTRPRGPLDPSAGTTCPPDPGCRVDKIWALDCSAMVYWIAANAGLKFSVNEGYAGSSFLSNPQNWTTAMTAPGSHNYSALSYELVTPQPALSALEPGDVIFKPNHIGIVLQNGANRWLYQSNGREHLCPAPTPNNANPQPCTNNDISTRGPRLVKLIPGDVNPLFSSQYQVLRLRAGGCEGGPSSVTDIDGNTYPVVQIGDQCWMAANLKTTRYNDGTSIPNVTEDNAWNQLNSGAWCAYNNSSANDATYGKLYNWYAASNPNICPQGWHVPTDAEWTVLTDHLGGSNVAGGKMKAVSPLWNAPNTGATNESGFSGLPVGHRDGHGGVGGGGYFGLGYYGYLWSASEMNPESAWKRSLWDTDAHLSRLFDSKGDANCVRCVRD